MDEKAYQPELSPEILISGYVQGIFPMAYDDGIYWFSPEMRGIIEFQNFKPGRHLRHLYRHHPFTIKIDADFEATIRACADRESTWINETIIEAYTELHKLGFAHSVETWHGDELLGGLYGVAIRAAFFGESMFSRARDASKVALLFLIERLKERNYKLLDTQYLTEHLARFNGIEIPQSEYLKRLNEALQFEAKFTGGKMIFEPPDPDVAIKRIKLE